MLELMRSFSYLNADILLPLYKAFVYIIVYRQGRSIVNQFCQVFTIETDGDVPILEPRTAEKLAAVEVTPDMVLKRLMKLKVGKSRRPGKIHPRLLCELAKQHL